MTIQHDAHGRADTLPVLERLVSRRVGQHAFFLLSGEGTHYPNGFEEVSGHVIDEGGQIYAFWTGWDDTRSEVTLEQWERVDPEPAWTQSDEYRQARQAAGLDSR